ncbi:hypothetical protein LEMLEM_LOCUS12102 [Lemmus lemmus]
METKRGNDLNHATELICYSCGVKHQAYFYLPNRTFWKDHEGTRVGNDFPKAGSQAALTT